VVEKEFQKPKTCERVPAAGPARVQSRLVKSEGSEQGYKNRRPKTKNPQMVAFFSEKN
jgi:hypothetical protein